MKQIWWLIFALAPSASACAQRPSAADRVADQFLADDRQPRPDDPKLAKDFDFLNQCSAKRIRTSDINDWDSREKITAKVHEAMEKCVEELYKGQ